MPEPFWVDEGGSEKAWDFCWLGDDLLPGIVDVDAAKAREVDKQKGHSDDGAHLADKGYVPGTVSIRLRIWRREQWERWQVVRPNIDPQFGRLRTPLPILHPEAQDAKIDTVYVEKISSSSPQKGGVKVIHIECVQWFPPKPAKSDQKKPSKVDEDTPPIPDVTLFG